jgi:hypothetical protein
LIFTTTRAPIAIISALIVWYVLKNFLQEKAVEATKQEKERKEDCLVCIHARSSRWNKTHEHKVHRQLIF